MVALHLPLIPSPAALIQSFKALSGISVDLGTLQAKAGNIVFGVGENKAAVALIPAAIPWQILKAPVQRLGGGPMPQRR